MYMYNLNFDSGIAITTTMVSYVKEYDISC